MQTSKTPEMSFPKTNNLHLFQSSENKSTHKEQNLTHNNFYWQSQGQSVHFPRTLSKHCFLDLTVSGVGETKWLFQLETKTLKSLFYFDVA